MTAPDEVTVTHPDVPRRELFRGSLEAAKRFVENNFPRPHHTGDGGLIYSAQINHADGGVSTFANPGDGTDGWTEPKAESVAETTPAVDAPVFVSHEGV